MSGAALSVGIVGAGIVGLTCAWQLVEAGHEVTVYDPDPGSGASFAAAGMLAPGGEAWFGEDEAVRIGVEAASLWPGLAARLGSLTGRDMQFEPAGTVLVGYDRSDLHVVQRARIMLQHNEIPSDLLDPTDLAEVEPQVSARVAGGLLVPGDHRVNPRRVTAALIELLGHRLVRARVQVRVAHGRATGVCRADGSVAGHDALVLASGVWLEDQPHVPAWLTDAVRPVRGEILRVRVRRDRTPMRRTVRASVHADTVYLVPRPDGEVVIGATMAEVGRDHRPTVEGVARLLSAARLVVPAIDDAEVVEVTARCRPGSPDNLPLVGPTGVDGLFAALGHYRNGVLLSPWTAREILGAVEGKDTRAATRPTRLHHASDTSHACKEHTVA